MIGMIFIHEYLKSRLNRFQNAQYREITCFCAAMNPNPHFFNLEA